MKTSELIKQLQELQQNIGDAEVVISNYQLTHYYDIKSVSIGTTPTHDNITLNFKF